MSDLREALNALSMWCTGERRKIRGGRGGFDNQTEREIGIAIVEHEIDRRAALAQPEAVERDNDRFKKLAPDHLAVFPEGFSAPLPIKTTIEMMSEASISPIAPDAERMRRALEITGEALSLAQDLAESYDWLGTGSNLASADKEERKCLKKIQTLRDDLEALSGPADASNASAEALGGRFKFLLCGRDDFIVSKGLWSEFVDYLRSRDAAGIEPAGADEGKESEGGRYTNTLCYACGAPQFNTPSGVTCRNGHGGADAAPSDPTAQREAIARIIDPVAFDNIGLLAHERKRKAVVKAERILALKTRAGG